MNYQSRLLLFGVSCLCIFVLSSILSQSTFAASTKASNRTIPLLNHNALTDPDAYRKGYEDGFKKGYLDGVQTCVLTAFSVDNTGQQQQSDYDRGNEDGYMAGISRGETDCMNDKNQNGSNQPPVPLPSSNTGGSF